MDIKNYIIGMITRWILKFAGAYFAALGYSSGSGSEFITGVLTFLLSVGISLYQHFKALNTPSASQIAK
jgi:hypothetical protein